MALDPLIWAMRSAPVADTEEWAVLAVMAESADQDGCNAFQATATIAERARLSARTVQRRIDDMTARGLIAAGDQQHRKLLEIPAHKRPVNYDLLIPCSWWGDVRWGETNRWRGQQGRKALRSSDRPDITEAPAKPRRATRRDESGVSVSQGVSGSHPLTTGHPVTGSPERGDWQSEEGCQAVTQPTPLTLPVDTPPASAADAPSRQTTRKRKAKAASAPVYNPAAAAVVKAYMDWWKATKGQPILKSSEMYHALVASYVTPALDAGHAERDIRNALASCARAGHEWPSDTMWRRVLGGQPALGVASSQQAQSPKPGSGAWGRQVVLPGPDDTAGVA